MHVDFHIPNLLKQFITLTLYFCRSLLPIQSIMSTMHKVITATLYTLILRSNADELTGNAIVSLTKNSFATELEEMPYFVMFTYPASHPWVLIIIYTYIYIIIEFDCQNYLFIISKGIVLERKAACQDVTLCIQYGKKWQRSSTESRTRKLL